MNLQISKSVIITGVFAMTLFSCSKESSGEVLSIGQSFENQETEEPATSTVEDAKFDLKSGEFSVFKYDEDRTATFHNLFTDGEDFMWSFPGATPATSTKSDPGLVAFPAAGDYTVTLNVTIDDEQYSHSETVSFE